MLSAFADKYHEASQNLTPKQFGLVVKECLELNNVCPFDIDAVTNGMFLSYLLVLKHPNGTFYSFSSYDNKGSAFMFPVSESGHIMTEERKANLSKIMKGLKKTIVQKLCNNRLRVTGSQDHITFECYQKIFIDDGTPELVFALCFYHAMESHLFFLNKGDNFISMIFMGE